MMRWVAVVLVLNSVAALINYLNGHILLAAIFGAFVQFCIIALALTAVQRRDAKRRERERCGWRE